MKNRLLKIKAFLSQANLDSLLVSSVPNIIYLTAYSGFSNEEREAFLVITKKNQYIITDGRYSEAVVEKISHFKLLEISSENKLTDILKILLKEEKIKNLGIEENNLTVSEYKLVSNCLNDLNHLSKLKPAKNLVESLRMIKEPKEILAIEKACLLGDKTFDHILNKIKPGITELGLAFEIEAYIKKNGADISFKPIVAFGKNSSVPHHQTSNQKLATSNQIILLDFGVKLNNYCSDMTRTVFFGSASAEFKRMYHAVLDAQQKALELLASRSNDTYHHSAGRVDGIARNHIIKSGYPAIPHSLGHGIGLEVHESPRLSPNSKDELKPGMVFSIEPGIYLPAGRHGVPGFGGVRIEDLVVLEKTGSRLLTHSSKELIEL